MTVSRPPCVKPMKAFLILAAILALLAFAMMAIPGFQFSIVLCFAFAVLLVLMHVLLKHPTPTTMIIFKIICILLAIGILAAAITLIFIVRAAHPSEPASCDYIVVLGAGVRGTVPSLSLKERIHAAYDYLSVHPTAVAVLSDGQGPREEITEAACMYRDLTKMGIDGNRLLLEENSTSTMENLTFSLDVLEEATGTRPAKIGIVSSEYHIFRAKQFAKSLDLEPVGIPAKTSWVSLRINYYLREIAAVWKYLVLGS